ncbi:MAG: NAD(P)-dependent oxidoreductase [Patescibacteria group bacterium]
MKATLLAGVKKENLTGILPDLELVPLDQPPDVIFVRSDKFDIPQSVFAICRAGSGTDNIDLARCNENGIVVFNASGANANAVKEWVDWGIKTAARKMHLVLEFVQAHRDKSRDELEKERSNFVGAEIAGKSIGVVGVGEVGRLVITSCLDDGMKVYAYDLFSKDKNFRGAQKVASIEELAHCDFISFHCSLTEKTRGLVNEAFLHKMKPGFILINTVRHELVDAQALAAALEDCRVGMYVSDFHDPDLASRFPDRVITTPHIGASTKEAEQNAQELVARRFASFWTTGTIDNSVNFETYRSNQRNGNCRFVIVNRNVPGMEHKIKGAIAEVGYNICRSHDESPTDLPLGYNIIDIDNADEKVDEIVQKISAIEGVKKVRVIR